MSPSNFDMQDKADGAFQARLRKLAALPVDTSGLERRLEAVIGVRPTSRGSGVRRPLRAWAAAAASVMVVAAVMLAVLWPGATLHAEPSAMARLHADIVAGGVPMTRVATVAEAAELIRRDWPDAPSLPVLPVEHDLACCLREFEGRRVVCLMFEDEGVPISVVIASGRSLRQPAPPNAATVHAVGGVNMVMKERDGRFVCVMGEVPASRLLQLIEAFTF